MDGAITLKSSHVTQKLLITCKKGLMYCDMLYRAPAAPGFIRRGVAAAEAVAAGEGRGGSDTAWAGGGGGGLGGAGGEGEPEGHRCLLGMHSCSSSS